MLSKSKIKYIQTLGQKKFREEEKCFIAEGPKLVAELLASDNTIIAEVFALPEWIAEHEKLLGKVSCHAITDIELEKISQLVTPNKVLAIVQQWDNKESVTANEKIVLALDDIRDPGNLGTIIRIADWFGISQIICSEESADVYNPKVVQSTMGSIGRVVVQYTDLAAWLATQDSKAIYATALAGKDITSMNKIKEGVIIIGNESKGISPAIMQLAGVKITIPQKGKAESLNAAVAAGIILSHLV
jgi:RNA methyltransferase, TrmH family